MKTRWMRAGAATAALGIGFGLAACGGESTAAPGPQTGLSAPTAGAAGPAVQPGASAEMGEADELRHHHAGVVMLIAMSIKDLNLPPDQRAAVEKIRTDLVAKMEPARSAEKDLAGVLADGVAAGAVDRAKADAAIQKLVTVAQGLHDATLDAMNQLHGALNAQQRAALVDALQAHWGRWKEANGHDEQDDPQHSNGHLLGLVKLLGLSADQAQKIKTAFRDEMKAAPQDHQHKEVSAHIQAFEAAFKADAFDAKSLATAKDANSRFAQWGATRMARFFEAAAPMLTPDQRTKLAQTIRDRAARSDQSS